MASSAIHYKKCAQILVVSLNKSSIWYKTFEHGLKRKRPEAASRGVF